jgi:N-acetylglucosaminyl-diphospho-decaprenol L-rhamnosyltransferase
VEAALFIPTAAGARFISRTLDELGPTWRARSLVVDNGSTDGTAELLRDRYPDVATLRLTSNVGFGPALNAGVQESAAGVVVVMNDDVLCPPSTLDRLVAAFADPAVGMVGGVLIGAGSGRVDTAGLACDPSLGSHDLLRGTPAARLDRPGGVSAPVGPSGGLAAFRRIAFDEVGGFDPGFFAYYEDVDLALRLRRAGWESRLVLDARALHVGSATAGWRSARKAGLVGLSRGRMLAKYQVLRRPRALPWLALEALGCVALGLELRSTIPFRARWRGYRDCAAHEPYPAPGAILRRSLIRAGWARLTRHYLAPA